MYYEEWPSDIYIKEQEDGSFSALVASVGMDEAIFNGPLCSAVEHVEAFLKEL